MSAEIFPFSELAPGVGIGAPAPGGWRSIAACPLLVLVGVTGVGKTTTLDALRAAGLQMVLLPDRRDLTDRIIIATMQRRAGLPAAPVKDRKLRFEYTRGYREIYAGGMAHALAQLQIDPAALPHLLLFDGLRGAEEVEHAAELLPKAKFAVLEAPDSVRVARLMGRNDPFDQIAGAPDAAPGTSAALSFAALGVPDAAGLFTAGEEQALLKLVAGGAASPEELRSSLAIVTEERRNYDPAGAAAALRRLAPDRTAVIDTTAFPPSQVADQILALLS